MSATTRLLKLAPLAIATTIAAGCDHVDDGTVDLSDLNIDFRGGDYKTTPQKLNTGYLGEEDLPLNNMPMIEGGDDEVEILDIRARKCRDSTGAIISGKFSRKATNLDIDVPLNFAGKLVSLDLAAVNDPSIICSISGALWENTFWDIKVSYLDAGGEVDEIVETELWLRDTDLDEHGMPVYQFKVNYPMVNPDYAGEIKWHNTCDEDLDPEDPEHAFHAYLLPDREVQSNGTYVDTPGTMYMACLSAAVGKAQNFGYSYLAGTDVAELGSRMVRADYCGDGEPHTVDGTPIYLQDALGVYGVTFPADEHAIEAVWAKNVSGAICLDNPRVIAQGPIMCGEGEAAAPLPPCGTMSGDITTLVPVE
ncbi:MAG: ADYC domain-containing protein [Myxococcota bacterium]